MGDWDISYRISMSSYTVYFIIERMLAFRDPEQLPLLIFNILNVWAFAMAIRVILYDYRGRKRNKWRLIVYHVIQLRLTYLYFGKCGVQQPQIVSFIAGICILLLIIILLLVPIKRLLLRVKKTLEDEDIETSSTYRLDNPP
jgi:uncharacterized membrane protein